MFRTAAILFAVPLLAPCAAGGAGEKGKDADKESGFSAQGEISLPVHKVKMEKGHLYHIEAHGKGFRPRVVIVGEFLGFGGFGPGDTPVPPPIIKPGALFEQPPLPPLPPLPPDLFKKKDAPLKKAVPADQPAAPAPAPVAPPQGNDPPVVGQPRPPIGLPIKPFEFRTVFTPKETKEYEIIVLPEPFGGEFKTKLEYTLSVKPAPKPILTVAAKWTEQDPKYGQRNTHFKAYPIKMKAGQQYTIDLVRTGNDFKVDPYLFLEDPAGKVVAEDDDSGGSLNSRIAFTPPADGEYRIIATTLFPATGDFTLTVRGPDTAKSTEKKE